MPLFSTVIPVYNRPDLVIETIESVLSQTFTDQEIIVMDDGSTDRTPEVLARYKDRVRLLRQDNQGLGVARNNALAAATGEYVIFLDSDDLWFPWTLQRFAEAIEKFNRPAIVLGPAQDFSVDQPLGPIADSPLRAEGYADYLSSWRRPVWLIPSSTAVRTDVLRRAGGFFPHRFTHEENDAWLRIGDAPGFVRIDLPVLCARRQHGGNISAFSIRNVQGAQYLIDRERAGEYPGGAARRRQRRALLTLHIRPVAIACARQGEVGWAWRLYRQIFGWSVALLRWRFVLGLPLIALASAVRRGWSRSAAST